MELFPDGPAIGSLPDVLVTLSSREFCTLGCVVNVPEQTKNRY